VDELIGNRALIKKHHSMLHLILAIMKEEERFKLRRKINSNNMENSLVQTVFSTISGSVIN